MIPRCPGQGECRSPRWTKTAGLITAADFCESPATGEGRWLGAPKHRSRGRKDTDEPSGSACRGLPALPGLGCRCPCAVSGLAQAGPRRGGSNPCFRWKIIIEVDVFVRERGVFFACGKTSVRGVGVCTYSVPWPRTLSAPVCFGGTPRRPCSRLRWKGAMRRPSSGPTVL